jgi:apolipoprotein D and lipocalin family protein
MNRMIFTLISAVLMLLFFWGCQTIPGRLTAVSPFDKVRYLGKWYEIARYDLVFERNLNQTTAEYTLNEDGSVRVVNRGYDTVKKKWRQASGTARFVGADTLGMLKVSFFGPFYAGYNVLVLDEDYRYALVCGSNRDYLWILSRTPSVPPDIRSLYLNKARAMGFDTEKLLWVDHENK